MIVADWEEFDQINRKDLNTMNEALLLEGRRMNYNLDGENTEGLTWP